MESFWAPSVLVGKQPHPNQVRFEGRRVEMVLKAFALEEYKFQLIKDYHTRWGSELFPAKRLTFESFHRFFPTFPYMMEGQSFFRTSGESPRGGAKALFHDFESSFVYQRYEVLLDRYRTFSDPEKCIFAQL